MNVNIALLAGDGIGPEIIAQAVKALDHVARKYAHNFTYREALVGACAIDATGIPTRRRRTKSAAKPTPCCSAPSATPNTTTTPKRRYAPNRAAAHAQVAGTVRQPAPHRALRHAGRPLAAQGRGGAGHRLRLRPRTDGRHLFRRPQGRDEGATGPWTPAPTRGRRSSACCTWRSGWP